MPPDNCAGSRRGASAATSQVAATNRQQAGRAQQRRKRASPMAATLIRTMGIMTLLCGPMPWGIAGSLAAVADSSATCVSDMVMFFPPMFISMLPRYAVPVVSNTATALPRFGPAHAMRMSGILTLLFLPPIVLLYSGPCYLVVPGKATSNTPQSPRKDGFRLDQSLGR